MLSVCFSSVFLSFCTWNRLNVILGMCSCCTIRVKVTVAILMYENIGFFYISHLLKAGAYKRIQYVLDAMHMYCACLMRICSSLSLAGGDIFSKRFILSR